MSMLAVTAAVFAAFFVKVIVVFELVKSAEFPAFTELGVRFH
jgi:hypothetical protein